MKESESLVDLVVGSSNSSIILEVRVALFLEGRGGAQPKRGRSMSGIVGEGLATRIGGGEGGGHRKIVLGR